jgi:hypothetical protein
MQKQPMARVLALGTTTMAAAVMALSATAPASASISPGTRATVQTAKVTTAATRSVKIKNGDRCVENHNGELETWAACVQGAGNQQWAEEDASYGMHKFENFGMCIDDQASNGYLSPCSKGDSDQRFSVDSATGGTWKIHHYQQWCLDLKYIIRTCMRGDGYQRWTLPST